MLLSLLLLHAPIARAEEPCGPGVQCVADLGQVVEAAAKPVSESAGHRPTGSDRVSKKMRRVYDAARKRLEAMGWLLRRYHKRDLAKFYANYQANKARYERVAAKTGIPAELIAALHWRESSGSFSKYLHQGDPLGRPARHVPKNIPVFYKWEDAAIHALRMKRSIRDRLRITSSTTDPAALATFAEYYNGLGYFNKGRPSPYVFSGTDQYTSGKYIRDRVYASWVKDRQLGVMAMIQYIRAMEGRPMMNGAVPTRPDLGSRGSSSGVLKRGSKGKRVEALQTQLKTLGYYSGPIDGDFGRGTAKAVKAFQRDQKIAVDGKVGSGTQSKLNEALADRVGP